MSATRSKQLRWVKQVQVAAGMPAVAAADAGPTTRERLVAALADRPRTVAQLAQAFGLAQPTVLEHIRRAVRDGLVAETDAMDGERRSAVERYYSPTVPVIRQPDRDLLHSACQAVANEFSASLERGRADLEASYAMTTLAREGWSFQALWPYMRETIHSLALAQTTGFATPAAIPAHGLAWVEERDLDGARVDVDSTNGAQHEEELA